MLHRVKRLEPTVRNHSTNPWVVLVLICLAQFMVVLDATIVNVALPSIQKDLHLSEGNLQWIVNAYTLVFGGFLLLGGRLGDLLGRKRLFLIGLVVFTGASLLDGLAGSEGMLIAARALQGLGAALVPLAPQLRHRRCGRGDGRLDGARLRNRRRAVGRLGLGADAGVLRNGRHVARRVRRDRVAREGAARAPVDLPHSLAPDGERRDAP